MANLSCSSKERVVTTILQFGIGQGYHYNVVALNTDVAEPANIPGGLTGRFP